MDFSIFSLEALGQVDEASQTCKYIGYVGVLQGLVKVQMLLGQPGLGPSFYVADKLVGVNMLIGGLHLE